MSVLPEPVVANELDAFRTQWLQELQQHIRINSFQTDDAETNEQKVSLARSLYQIGIAEERAGNPFKAVNFYAKACRLCPDIEKEFEAYHDSPDLSVGSSITNTPAFLSDDEDDDEAGTSQITPVTTQFDGLSLQPPANCTSGWLCEAENVTTDTHISALPFELISLILRLVVFPDFDFRSLEQCALVCRGFYTCARNNNLYKIACHRVWGDKLPLSYENLDWRSIYIKRPRMNFHGIYISKVTYVRQGERTFDSSSDIFITAEYFRYLRVFPNGLALMYTSPEDPALVVPKLKHPNCRLSGIKTGHYILQGDKVKVLLTDLPPETPVSSRSKRSILSQKDWHNTFYLTLAITAVGKKPSCKLTWLKYSMMNSRVIKGVVSSAVPTELNVNSSQFKPFFFSRVRSYTSSTVSGII